MTAPETESALRKHQSSRAGKRPKRIPDIETQQYIWMDKYRRGIAVERIAREHDVTSQYIYRRLQKLCGKQWEEERLQHNMARPGSQERLERRVMIHDMARRGCTWTEIAQATGATIRTIRRTLSDKITKHLTRYQSIIVDYESGMTQKEIAHHYNLGQSTVSSIINRFRGVRSTKTARNIAIIRSRSQGMTIKELALHHGLTEQRIRHIIATNKWIAHGSAPNGAIGSMKHQTSGYGLEVRDAPN